MIIEFIRDEYGCVHIIHDAHRNVLRELETFNDGFTD